MLKKLMSTKWIVLIFSIALIASCGGGGGGSSPGGGGSCGGGDDCVSFAFDSGTEIVRTETYDPSALPNPYDPYVTSSYASGSNRTSITSKYGYNGVGYNETLEIAFFGTTAGTYPASSNIIYTSASNANPYTADSGDIIVSTYDPAAGGHIQGSFDITVCTLVYYTPPCPTANSKHMTGTFYVTRTF